GGSFTTAGGVAANYIAKWNGTNWSTFGSGMNNRVGALAVSGGQLYVTGSFMTAGGRISAFMARAYLDLPVLSTLRSGTNLTISWPLSYGAFGLQQNGDVANSNGWSNAEYLISTNGAMKNATVPGTPGNQFFRLIGN